MGGYGKRCGGFGARGMMRSGSARIECGGSEAGASGGRRLGISLAAVRHWVLAAGEIIWQAWVDAEEAVAELKRCLGMQLVREGLLRGGMLVKQERGVCMA